MAANLDVIAGDECVCACHRDPSIHHVVACCADCDDCATRVTTIALPTHKPGRCSGFRTGRLALQVDAVVCVLAGIALVVTGFVWSFMPIWLHIVLGLVALASGINLWFTASRQPLRAVLALTLALDLMATVVFIVIGLLTDGRPRPVAFFAAAVFALFAIWKWVALRKTQGAPVAAS
jgi:hypothetical protein